MTLSGPQLQGLNKTWRGVDGADISKQYTIGPSSYHDKKHVIPQPISTRKTRASTSKAAAELNESTSSSIWTFSLNSHTTLGQRSWLHPRQTTRLHPPCKRFRLLSPWLRFSWAKLPNVYWYGWPAAIVFDDYCVFFWARKNQMLRGKIVQLESDVTCILDHSRNPMRVFYLFPKTYLLRSMPMNRCYLTTAKLTNQLRLHIQNYSDYRKLHKR